MDEREQQRKIKHRLNVLRHAEEVTGNVARTCRYFWISRPTFDKWRDRFEESGPEGGLRDLLLSAPPYMPRANPGRRGRQDHPPAADYHFGPHKIAMYLAPRPRRRDQPARGSPGSWKRLGSEPAAGLQTVTSRKQRWHRDEKPQPGHRLQVDVKFIEPLAGPAEIAKKYYQFTAIDDCTRLRVLRIYPTTTSPPRSRFID